MCEFSTWLAGYASSHSPDRVTEVGHKIDKVKVNSNTKFQMLGSELGAGATQTYMTYLMEFADCKVPRKNAPWFRLGIQVGDVLSEIGGC